jgi:hypothetical protein
LQLEAEEAANVTALSKPGLFLYPGVGGTLALGVDLVPPKVFLGF